jgi:hypothetical protein
LRAKNCFSKQFFRRVPEKPFEINYLIVFDFHPFFLQELFHPFWWMVVMPSAEQALAIHYPVGGDGRLSSMGGNHCPSNHPCRRSAAQKSPYGSIGGNPAFWYLAGDLMDLIKERVVPLPAGQHWLKASAHAWMG